MKRYSNWGLILLLLPVFACNNESKPNPQAEKDDVEQVFTDFMKEVEAGNTDGYFKYVTKDFLGYDAGMEPISNPDSLRAFLNDFFSHNILNVTDRVPQEVIIRDDIAIYRHLGTMVITPKNDSVSVEIPVKYLDVLRKKNGVWKMYIHSASPNQ